MAKSSASATELLCETWSDLRSAVAAKQAALFAKGEMLWFRGCSDSNHTLLPSLMRDTQELKRTDHNQFEQDVFFEFQARSGELRSKHLTEWEYLFFGRHFGMPTRVLDWTDTFAVALYFSLEGWKVGIDRTPSIWIINPYELNEKTWDFRDIILPRYLGSDSNGVYLDFGELLVADGPWDWDGPVAIYPIQINERVRAQRGWFTVHGNDRRPLEQRRVQGRPN
jgi:hypothetical protein